MEKEKALLYEIGPSGDENAIEDNKGTAKSPFRRTFTLILPDETSFRKRVGLNSSLMRIVHTNPCPVCRGAMQCLHFQVENSLCCP